MKCCYIILGSLVGSSTALQLETKWTCADSSKYDPALMDFKNIARVDPFCTTHYCQTSSQNVYALYLPLAKILITDKYEHHEWPANGGIITRNATSINVGKQTGALVYVDTLPEEYLSGFCLFGFVLSALLLAYHYVQTALDLLEIDVDQARIFSVRAKEVIEMGIKATSSDRGLDHVASTDWPFKVEDLELLLYLMQDPLYTNLSPGHLSNIRKVRFNDFANGFSGAHYQADMYLLQERHGQDFGSKPSVFEMYEQLPKNDVLRMAVFGIHGSLMMEPAETLAAIFPVEAVGFYGMNHPSKFRCKVLNACDPDNLIVDRHIHEYILCVKKMFVRHNNIRYREDENGSNWNDEIEDRALQGLREQSRLDNKLVVENLDFVVCTTARLCPLVEKVYSSIPMVFYSSMPLMFSSPSAAHDQLLLHELRELIDKDGAFAAVTSPMWSAQFLYQLGVKLPAVKPLASYTRAEKPEWLAVERTVALMARSRVLLATTFGIAFLKILDQHPSNITVLPGWDRWMEYNEIRAHNAVVLIPHDPVMMAFYDFLALCVPTFLPSKRMMARIFGTRGYALYWRDGEPDARLPHLHNNSQHKWDVTPLHTPQEFANNFFMRHVLPNLCSWYAYPHVQFFDSVSDLVDQIADEHYPRKAIALRNQMQEEYEQQQKLVYSYYAKWLGNNIENMYERRTNCTAAV